MDDRLVIVATGQGAVSQPFCELPRSFSYIEHVGVYRDNKPGNSPCVPLSKRLNLICVLFPHILLTGSLSRRQRNIADRVSFIAQAIEVLPNKTLLPLILYKDDDLRWLTQAPIRVQPVRLA